MRRVITLNTVFMIIILFSVIIGYAQALDTLWTRTYGGIENDFGYFVQQTADGGFIIIGSTKSSGVDSSGVYFYLLTAGDVVETKKMLLLR